MTRRLVVLALAVFAASCLSRSAQAADLAEELRFVQALRSERYYDLAEQYLARLEKTAPAAAAGDIAFERLNILLDRAGDEPDTHKRLARFDDVREKFQEMASNPNPNDRRAAAARLALANVTRAQAHVQLSVALSRTGPDRLKEGEKARLLLVQAQKQLQEVVAGLDDQVKKAQAAKTPEELKEKAHLENAARQVHFDLALNLFDQAITYPDNGTTALRKLRSDKVEEARTALNSIATGSPTSSQTWQARAWLARCKVELGESDATIGDALTAVLNSREAAAADGRRLALYFSILRDEEKAQDKVKAVEEGTRRWLAEYGRYKNTPEGYGVRYLRAKALMARSGQPNLQPGEKDNLLTSARNLVGELELTDNEYSYRALKLKLALIDKQNGFAKPVVNLNTFEDCFLRARFELYRVYEDAKEIKEADKLREQLEKHYETALAALQRGLTLPDAQVDPRKEPRKAANVATARASLPYYFTQLARSREAARDTAQANRFFREAVRTGESFVRARPDAEQADQAAIYVLDAYTRLIGTDGSAEDRANFMKFAELAEEKWGDSNPGNLARQRRAAMLFTDKTASPAQHVEDVKKAILLLGRISPTYPSYPYAQYSLAEAAQMADREKYDPIKEPGKPEISYRQRAMAALRLIPDIAGTDTDSNRLYVRSRIKLGDELYKEGLAAIALAKDKKGAERDAPLAEAMKHFTEMDQLASALLPRLDKLEFVGTEGQEGATDPKRAEADKKLKEQDAKIREEYHFRLETQRLYAAYGAAAVELSGEKFGPAGVRLDPIIDRIKAGTLEEVRNNPDLALALLNVALKANVQANKPDRVLIAVQALVEYEVAKRIANVDDADKPKAKLAAREPAVVSILILLGDLSKRQTEELTSNNDMVGLERFKKGMKDILVALEKEVPNPGNETLYYFAKGWYTLGMPDKAIPYLDKITEPKSADGKPLTAGREVDIYRLGRILYIRLLRASKDYAQARKVIDEAIGPDKMGWGAPNVDVRKEAIHVAVDEGKYVEGGRKADSLLVPLNKLMTGPNAADMKAHYLEVYHLFIYCIVKNAQSLKKPEDRKKEISNAAERLKLLLDRFPPDFGGGESAKRFADLLAQEPELKVEFDKLNKRPVQPVQPIQPQKAP